MFYAALFFFVFFFFKECSETTLLKFGENAPVNHSFKIKVRLFCQATVRKRMRIVVVIIWKRILMDLPVFCLKNCF